MSIKITIKDIPTINNTTNKFQEIIDNFKRKFPTVDITLLQDGVNKLNEIETDLNKKLYALQLANYYLNIKKNQETINQKFIYDKTLKEVEELNKKLLTQKENFYLEKLKFVKMLRVRGFFIY
jgi:hypothetical protein